MNGPNVLRLADADITMYVRWMICVGVFGTVLAGPAVPPAVAARAIAGDCRPVVGPDLSLTLNLKSGATVSDVATITARVQSDVIIDKVEFQFDNEPAVVVTSVPYTMDWDTMPVSEGPHTLRVTAYDSDQRTKQVTITLVVDNELGLGAPALARKGADARTAGNAADATRWARRSLKATPHNLAAERVLAEIAADSRDWDAAITDLEAGTGLDRDPSSIRLLASYRIRRALKPENAPRFYTDFAAVLDLRHKAADLDLESVRTAVKSGAGLDAARSHEELGDALMAAARTADATAEYAKGAEEDNPPLSTVTRLALAYALTGQSHEAVNLLLPLERAKTANAAVRAVHGLALLRERKFEEARAIIDPADIAGHVPASLVVAAFADTVLGNSTAAAAEARDAVERAPGAAEAHYALSMAATDPDRSEQELFGALMLEHFETGPYLDYAVRLALRSRDYDDEALDLARLALEADPDNVNAQLLQVLIYLRMNRISDAAGILDPLAKKETTAADVAMAVAVYWDTKQNGALIDEFMNRAAKLDPARFTWTLPQDAVQYLFTLNRKLHYRAGFFLTPGVLSSAQRSAPPG